MKGAVKTEKRSGIFESRIVAKKKDELTEGGEGNWRLGVGGVPRKMETGGHRSRQITQKNTKV